MPESLLRVVRAGNGKTEVPDLIAMLYGYFDDSSDGQRRENYACGGLVGDEDEWGRFDLLWIHENHVLKAPFRSTDCETQNGQFSDWNKHDCVELMKRLVSVIHDHKLGGFASIVPVQAYRQVYADAHKYDPFYLAVRDTIANMAHIAASIDQRVVCCFEEGPHQGRIKEIYKEMKAVVEWKNRHRLAGISFYDKRMVRLQSADLIAREAFKHIFNLGKRPTRKPVERLSKRISFRCWTRESLEGLRDLGGPSDMRYFIYRD